MRQIMNKPLSSAVLVVGVCLACSSVQVGGRAQETEDLSSLSTITLDDIYGNAFSFSEHAGKEVLFVSFWATFCKPCKSEMPFLQKLHETWGGKGLKVVSISLDDPATESMVKPLIERNNYTFTVLIDRQSSAAQLLNPKSVLPFLLVFDKSGRLVLRKDGFSIGDQPGLEKLVSDLVEGSGP